MKNKRFATVFNPILKICLFLLLILIPAGLVLPPWWGQENKPVENIQLLVLVANCVVIYKGYRFGVGSKESRKLILWAFPLMIIVILRELSWGRVFYPDGNGWFLPLEQLWFGVYVYPAIAVIFIAVVVGIFRQKLHKELIRWLKYGKIPLMDTLLIVGCYFAAGFVEHSKIFHSQRQDLFEELFELVMYLAVMSLFFNLGFNKEIQPASSEAADEER